MLNFFIDAQLLTCTTFKDANTPQVTSCTSAVLSSYSGGL